MKYETPQIVVAETAVKAVQNLLKMGLNFDTKPSNAAYHSDE